MSDKEAKIILWCAIAVGAIVNILGWGTLASTAHAGRFDGQYLVAFNGEVRREGNLVEEYETESEFTIKNGGLYSGLTTDKNQRTGRIKYTGKNKATIIIGYWGQGRITLKIHRIEDGTLKGKGYGWFIGEDGLRYTLRISVNAEIIGQ